MRHTDPGAVLGSCGGVVAVLPMGSLEHHPGNLPLSIDSIIANRLAERLAEAASSMIDEDLCLFLLPPLSYGFSHEWLRFKGTASVSPDLLIRTVVNIAVSLRESTSLCGFIIVNAHGGNTSVAEAAARLIYYSHGVEAAVIDIWVIAGELGNEFCHGCGLEAEIAGELGLSYQGGSPDEKKLYCSDTIHYCRHDLVVGAGSGGPRVVEEAERRFIETLDVMARNCLSTTRDHS